MKSLQTAGLEKRPEYFSSLEFESPACTSTSRYNEYGYNELSDIA